MAHINLILLQTVEKPVQWILGEVYSCLPENRALARCINDRLQETTTDAWLIWDSSLDLPDVQVIEGLLTQKSDVWHVGLALGLGGQPEMIDFVSPTWMLNRDPEANNESTSWRLSLRACLIRTEVLRQLGGPESAFQTLEGAGLELGYRFITRGAIVRNHPGLIKPGNTIKRSTIPIEDQLLFIRNGYGKAWTAWAGVRAVLTGFSNPVLVRKARKSINNLAIPVKHGPYLHEKYGPDLSTSSKVSVLIPTLRRYPYLRVLLNQIRTQTVMPSEILVVDQSPKSERDPKITAEFSGLPVRWFYLDQAGQCSSRNFGMREAKGDFILFLDDDDEIQSDLIEKHLGNLVRFQSNISNGVAHEVDAGELPPDFQFLRVSNVFPANNTLINRKVLHQSGLFDLAYDRGQRADHDLGMRLYLSGELMILDPKVEILHHHAPKGGLREHKARVNTYAASRSNVFKQNLLTVSDFYLAKRYFTSRQVREMAWINILGTFSMQGSILKKVMKVLASTVLLPINIFRLMQRSKIAETMFKTYPQIPEYPGKA